MMKLSRAAYFLFVTVGLAWSWATPLKATEYYHGYAQTGYWGDTSAWVPNDIGIPGENDIANLYYGISLENVPAVSTVGTLNIDTYNNWGPPGQIDLRAKTLNIINGGRWMWGGFNDYYNRTGIVNQYGTFHLIDDISDHYNNGTTIVDPVTHSIQWKTTFNNYGTMLHDGQGTFHLGADACQYVNHGLHDFISDGDITTQGHGGEQTTNFGTIRKSGGIGSSDINGELDNQGAVEVLSGTLAVNNSLQYESAYTHVLESGKWIARNNGSLVITGRGTLEINRGHVILDSSDANLYTTQTSTYTPIEDSLLSNEGILEVYGDRIFAANVLSNSGTLVIGDDTTLSVGLANSGCLAVGNSPGRGLIDGDFEQGVDGILQAELAGLLAGNEYDVLEVTGTATLNGTLDLSYDDDFTAGPGESFTILNATNLIGEFQNVVYPDAQPWYIEYDLGVGTVTVGVVPEPTTAWLLVTMILAIAWNCRFRRD